MAGYPNLQHKESNQKSKGFQMAIKGYTYESSHYLYCRRLCDSKTIFCQKPILHSTKHVRMTSEVCQHLFQSHRHDMVFASNCISSYRLQLSYQNKQQHNLDCYQNIHACMEWCSSQSGSCGSDREAGTLAPDFYPRMIFSEYMFT